MVLASLVASDATGGGVGAAPTGCPALTVPGPFGKDAMFVGYSLGGVSVNESTLTVATDERWPAAGFSLRPTDDGTAVGRGKSVHWFKNPTPIKCGATLTPTISSGANYAWQIMHFDVPVPGPAFARPALDSGKEPMYKWTRTTGASGTNLTANTLQTGLVTLTQFTDFDWIIDDITVAAAFTTNPIIGLKSEGADSSPYRIFMPLPLTDVAQDWDPIPFPGNQIKIGLGTTLDVAWVGETAEQPTANITFKRKA